MNWETVILLLVVATAVLLIRRLALVSAGDACRYLAQGALIVDVRDPGEFNQGHVTGAVNLPLSGLPENLLTLVSDKERVLLLHCQGGGRSAIAKRLLKASGYAYSYNLGSYRRAERIARSSGCEAMAIASHTPPGAGKYWSSRMRRRSRLLCARGSKPREW